MKDLLEFFKELIKGDDDSKALKYYNMVLSAMGFFGLIVISIVIIIVLFNISPFSGFFKAIAIFCALIIVLPIEIGYMLYVFDKYD